MTKDNKELREEAKLSVVDQFEKEYTDFVNAQIVFAEVQEVYQPVSFEHELQWIKSWIAVKLDQARTQAREEVLKDLLAIAEAGELEELRREVALYVVTHLTNLK